jgi:hypothetical protein
LTSAVGFEIFIALQLHVILGAMLTELEYAHRIRQYQAKPTFDAFHFGPLSYCFDGSLCSVG